jgi:hypothetical protein
MGLYDADQNSKIDKSEFEQFYAELAFGGQASSASST